MSRVLLTKFSAFWSVALSICSVGVAGPLSPPAGPITSTYKTLTEVEPRTPISSIPFTITQSGSYYLTRNLIGSSGAVGITIAANNVTIDLNGFTLDGNSGQGDRGIHCPSVNNLIVRNGRVTNWHREGINGYLSHQARLEDIIVQDCSTGWGIIVGYTSVVTNCQSRGCAAGIIVADASTVSNCTVDQNARGFEIGAASTVTNCVAASSGGHAFDIGVGTSLTNCTARGNGLGFSAGAQCVFSNCSSTANGGAGFVVGGASVLTHCVSDANNGPGFQMDGAGQLLECTSSGNTGIGVDITPPGGGTAIAGMISGCTINFNASHGINQVAGGGSTFTGNTIARNGGTGIVVQDGNMISNNRIVDNGLPVAGAGLVVAGVYNTIQGNSILNNGAMYSFAASSSGNLFFGNTCHGGNQFNTGVNNSFGNFISPGVAFSGNNLGVSNSFVNILY